MGLEAFALGQFDELLSFATVHNQSVVALAELVIFGLCTFAHVVLRSIVKFIGVICNCRDYISSVGGPSDPPTRGFCLCAVTLQFVDLGHDCFGVNVQGVGVLLLPADDALFVDDEHGSIGSAPIVVIDTV